MLFEPGTNAYVCKNILFKSVDTFSTEYQGMDLYFKRHDGQAVTCEDFYAAMRDANDADFANFLLWFVLILPF